MDSSVLALEGLSDKARKTAKRYYGDDAVNYEKKRSNTAKWEGEGRKVREFLNRLMAGSSVLDIPCGTGRFFDFYKDRRLKVLAMDVSPDMIAQAQHKAAPNIRLDVGSIFDMEVCGIFDVVLCIRFLNLIEPKDLERAFSEMQRVGRSIVFTLRVHQKNPTGHYHNAYPISMIEKFLLPGWEIKRNEAVHEEDYRIIEVAQ